MMILLTVVLVTMSLVAKSKSTITSNKFCINEQHYNKNRIRFSYHDHLRRIKQTSIDNQHCTNKKNSCNKISFSKNMPNIIEIKNNSNQYYQNEDFAKANSQLSFRTDAIIPCGRFDITKEKCIKFGCQWRQLAFHRAAPPCSYKQDTGYDVIGDIRRIGTKYKIRLRRKGAKSIFGMVVFRYMNVEIDMYGSKALRIYYYPDHGVYEVPEEALSIKRSQNFVNTKYSNITFKGDDSNLNVCSTVHTLNKDYTVTFTRQPYFGIQVVRKASGTVVFNSSLPGLTFSSQFIQHSTRLSSSYLYGFGYNNHEHFKHDINWRLWTLFVRAQKPIGDWNYYSAHPVYMNLENDGNANMVLLKNSNAMDIFLQPDPYPTITYRPIGGTLDFYIFLGTSPEDALQQYLEAIGRPVMPPYWSLGFHLCKWEIGNISDVEAVVERTKQAKIPQDGQWLDIDYMDKWFVFTYSKDTFNGLPELIKKLHREGQRVVVTVNHGISNNASTHMQVKSNRLGYSIYEDGVLRDLYIKNPEGGIFEGKMWPGTIAFADFTNTKNVLPWWQHYIKYFYNIEGVKFDGLWLDKNEPDNLYVYSLDRCTKNRWDSPPYLPNVLDGLNKGGCLYGRTVCMDSILKWGRHYDVHNLFGSSMSMVTNRALQNIFPDKRPFVMTRSSFPGTGKYAMTWLGDNDATWQQMSNSIVGVLEYGLFGFSMVGADICGFDLETEYELCIRWTQLGSFYPFARNHNRRALRDQDPAVWGSRFVKIVRKVLLTRYRVLPYMYTLFHDAHMYGKPVARPLMFEFPNDRFTWDMYKQFLVGPALMVSPVLQKGDRFIGIYFPKAARWFDYYNGKEINETGTVATLPAPLETINLHLRGGYIIPVQTPANNTVYSRKNPLELLIIYDDKYNANGYLFWDDGESKDTFERGNYLYLTFNSSKGLTLDINVQHNNYPEADSLVFGTIEFYGLDGLPFDVFINGRRLHSRHINRRKMIVKFTNLNLKITENHNLWWNI